MLAGGESCRFGKSKVLAPLSGAPMASWGLSVLEAAGLTVGVIVAIVVAVTVGAMVSS